MPSRKIVGEALTYDDVLLVPHKSSVLPRDVDVRSRLTRVHHPQHPAAQRSDGYRDRIRHGHRHGP